MPAFDASRLDGPDRTISAYAFRAWARVDNLTDAPELQRLGAQLPPTFIAVGERDSLLPESRSLAASCRQAGVRCTVLELPHKGHGFMGGDAAGSVLQAMLDFTISD